MKKEIMKKIEARQKNITTNEDLSGFEYSKHGLTSNGVLRWQSKEAIAKSHAITNPINNPINNPITNPEICRKGGKYYNKKLVDHRTGLQGARNKIRIRHAKSFQKYKAIIAPGSQIHHQWEEGTANYTGIALVEADAHQHGNIRVIEVLNGEITLFKEPGIV